MVRTQEKYWRCSIECEPDLAATVFSGGTTARGSCTDWRWTPSWFSWLSIELLPRRSQALVYRDAEVCMSVYYRMHSTAIILPVGRLMSPSLSAGLHLYLRCYLVWHPEANGGLQVTGQIILGKFGNEDERKHLVDVQFNC